MRITRTDALLLLTFAALLAILMTSCAPRGSLPPVPKAPDMLGTLLAWTVVAAIAGIGACVALMIWTPAKKTALAGIGGFGAMIITTLSVQAMRPYMIWAVLAGFLALVGGVVWVLIKTDLAKRLAVRFGLEVENATSEAEVAIIKSKHAAIQRIAGVHTQITKALDQAKATT